MLGLLFSCFQTVVGEDTVFTHNRNDVRCNTHSYNIQQRNQVVELDTVTDSECLHKLETDSTTRKVECTGTYCPGVWRSE